MKVEDMSPADRLKSVKGEASQGNYLVSAKEDTRRRKTREQLIAIAREEALTLPPQAKQIE